MCAKWVSEINNASMLWRERKDLSSSACWVRPLAFYKARRRVLVFISVS
jgi:hypothetical protein